MPVVLYERQRQILDFLSQYTQKHGYSPSLKDIAEAMGLNSLATVHEHLARLKKKGVIKIDGRGKTRKISIVDERLAESYAGVQVPILGFLTPGETIKPYVKGSAFFLVPSKMIRAKKRCFILEAKGNVLKDEGIYSGDLIILEENVETDNGQTIVGLLENNIAVIKRITKETTRVKLESLNSDESPMYVPKVQVQGKVIGLIRRY